MCALIAFLIALQWKCENLLSEKQPNFAETSTTLDFILLEHLEAPVSDRAGVIGWILSKYGKVIKLSAKRRQMKNTDRFYNQIHRMVTQGFILSEHILVQEHIPVGCELPAWKHLSLKE